jgi:hypothetical protein
MADKAGGKAAADSGQWPQLRVVYGNALIAGRGYGAPETTEAFTRARESATGDRAALESARERRSTARGVSSVACPLMFFSPGNLQGISQGEPGNFRWDLAAQSQCASFLHAVRESGLRRDRPRRLHWEVSGRGDFHISRRTP